METLIYKYKLYCDTENHEDALITLEALCSQTDEMITYTEVDYTRRLKKSILAQSKEALDNLNNLFSNKRYNSNLNKTSNLRSFSLNAEAADESAPIGFKLSQLKPQEYHSSSVSIFKNYSTILISKYSDLIEKLLFLVNAMISKVNNLLKHVAEDIEDRHEISISLINIKASILAFMSIYFINSSKNTQSAYLSYLQGIELSLHHLNPSSVVRMRISYSFMKFMFYILKDSYRSFLFCGEYQQLLLKEAQQFETDEEECTYFVNKFKLFHDKNIESFKNSYKKYFPKYKRDVF